MQSYNLIGLTGVANAGKDHLFLYLKYLLLEKKIDAKRFSLADELKRKMDDFLKKETGISAFTIDKKEKDSIRGLMVEFGRFKRIQTQGTYWTGLIQQQVSESILKKEQPILTDLRYVAYPKDEYDWVKNQNKGVVIHISRLDKSGALIGPPNEEEARNNPKLLALADYKITWPTLDKFENVVTWMAENGHKENLLKLLCN